VDELDEARLLPPFLRPAMIGKDLIQIGSDMNVNIITILYNFEAVEMGRQSLFSFDGDC
jgi:hypothetical protein